MESGRCWDWHLDVMVFLRMWMGGGIGGTDDGDILLLYAVLLQLQSKP